MSEHPSKVNIYTPLLLSAMLIMGIFLGHNVNFGEKNKIDQVVGLIENRYVDSIDNESLEEKIIENILPTLDPHSYFIKRDDLASYDEPLKGSFYGIGIQYLFINDTLVVSKIINDGPAEKAGLKAGDRIVKANNIALDSLKNNVDSVKKYLKGVDGSIVDLKIIRRNNKPQQISVTRGKVKILSIPDYYMINDSTGYLKIERFGATTSDEFIRINSSFLDQGMKYLIIDLRNNGGGYLNAAIEILDEILPNETLLVYTEGRKSPKEEYYATDIGDLKETKIAVLINSNSASASEIVAGAIQDNDRGTVIGRRSFGKGLVQESYTLEDGSAIRLTVARYYTPTGRCIQKPYGDEIDYFHDGYLERYYSGELVNEDSIKVNEDLKFTTPKGKTVYGGGGIVPDIFVPIDTTSNKLWSKYNISYEKLQKSSFTYFEENKEILNAYTSIEDYIKNFTISDAYLKKNFADTGELTQELKDLLKAYIASYLYPNQSGFYQIENQTDPVVIKALNY